MTDRDLQQKRYLAAGIDVAVLLALGIVFLIVGGILGFAFSRAGGTSLVGVYLPRVVAFLAHDASSYITGQVWAVNGGLDM